MFKRVVLLVMALGLLCVVAVGAGVGMLMVGGSLAVQGALSEAQEGQTQIQIARARERVDLYTLRKGAPPASLADAMDGSVPLDAWGHPLVYESQGRDSFTIHSVGPDGQSGTPDDIHSDPYF